MKLVIGSAQFGSSYGISNDHFLDEAASHNIMEHLLTKNYDHIDAALAYGKSNNIIKSFPKKIFNIFILNSHTTTLKQ